MFHVKHVVLALEVLGLLLIAAGACAGVMTLVGLWAGLLSAGLVVLIGAWRGQSLTEDGERGATVRPTAPRS